MISMCKRYTQMCPFIKLTGLAEQFIYFQMIYHRESSKPDKVCCWAVIVQPTKIIEKHLLCSFCHKDFTVLFTTSVCVFLAFPHRFSGMKRLYKLGQKRRKTERIVERKLCGTAVDTFVYIITTDLETFLFWGVCCLFVSFSFLFN